MRTQLTRVLVTLTTALALAACSGEETPADDETTAAASPTASSSSPTESEEPEPTKEPEPEGTVVAITIKGDTVDPNGDQVKVPLGEPVILAITADRAGELHVHSSPEEEIAFKRGKTEAELTFKRPGVVEVEDHDSGKIIVELQVS
ncbi:MAG: hypothetical protein ACXWDI_00080 [Nocardioides sp.]